MTLFPCPAAIAIACAAACSVTPACAFVSLKTLKSGLWETSIKTTSHTPATIKAVAEAEKLARSKPSLKESELNRALREAGMGQLTDSRSGAHILRAGPDHGECHVRQG